MDDTPLSSLSAATIQGVQHDELLFQILDSHLEVKPVRFTDRTRFLRPSDSLTLVG
jgi:hypothetical protein